MGGISLYGTGGSFIMCSKITFKSEQVEILHSAFKSYTKNYPYFYLKEQPEDNYNIRIQANCDWISEDRLEEVVWGLLAAQKERGQKVFDCEGNEIVFEQEENSEK
jgi:hypothetical protein